MNICLSLDTKKHYIRQNHQETMLILWQVGHNATEKQELHQHRSEKSWKLSWLWSISSNIFAMEYVRTLHITWTLTKSRNILLWVSWKNWMLLFSDIFVLPLSLPFRGMLCIVFVLPRTWYAECSVVLIHGLHSNRMNDWFSKPKYGVLVQ